MRETKSNKKISLKQVKNCALVEQESERCVCMCVWGRLKFAISVINTKLHYPFISSISSPASQA